MSTQLRLTNRLERSTVQAEGRHHRFLKTDAAVPGNQHPHTPWWKLNTMTTSSWVLEALAVRRFIGWRGTQINVSGRNSARRLYDVNGADTLLTNVVTLECTYEIFWHFDSHMSREIGSTLVWNMACWSWPKPWSKPVLRYHQWNHDD